MSVQSLSPNLMVRDVNATVDFYKLLGFELIQSVPAEGTFDWAMVGAGAVTLMFQKEASLKEEYPTLAQQELGGALTLYLTVADAAGLFAQLNGSVTMVKAMHKTFYGADEFAILDPNGFVLTISQHTDQ